MRRLFPVSIVCLAVLVSCGNGAVDKSSSSIPISTGASTVAGTAAATAGTAAAKPTVKIPATLPTKLVITDLIDGTGDPAKVGDTVDVNYVGVRSADGTEFDNSYDRGQTFPVKLGANSVIAGWEQGLIGIKAGGRRQLDIPADLAYGNSPQGKVIKAGDALTFVIDAVSVTAGVAVPTANPADKPVVSIPTSVGATKPTATDLVVGTGETAVFGQQAYIQIIAYRGDTAAELQSTWATGQAAQVGLDSGTVTGLVNGIIGMKVGGRRLLTLPPADAFGPEGNTTMGLPANTDVILLVDLVLLTSTP